MSYEHTPKAILEANASHAYGQYLCMGPSKPYSQMRPTGLESVRSRLAASPSAANQEAQAWVAIEQAFVVNESTDLKRQYPTEHFFEEAEEAFRTSIALYDEAEDPPDHTLNVELALGALPLYKIWAGQEAFTHREVSTFHGSVVEIGHKLIALNEDEGQGWDSETQKTFGGFAGEIVTLLAFNRRQQDGFNGAPAFAIPSTLRQDKARQPGRGGSAFDKTRLRGNWDVSVLEQSAGRLALRDKLQVKSITVIADKPQYGAARQEYTDDITVVSVKGHICHGMNLLSNFEALQALLDASVPGARKKQKAVAATMSRELYGHIARAREKQAGQNAERLHVYRDNPHPRRK